MNPLTLSLLSFVIVAGITFVTGALLLRWRLAVGGERLKAPVPEAGPASILRWDEQTRTSWQRLLAGLGRTLGPRDTTRVSGYRKRLGWAGYHNPRATIFFLGAKGGLAILCGLLYPIYAAVVERILPNLLLVSFVLAVVGFYLPDFWLRNRIRERQRKIVNTLPDVLDLLLVCVEAGMAFDAAVARIAEQPEGRQSPLHQELLRMHLETRAGRPRGEAMRAFGERTGVQEVKAVVGAFVQTERLGTSLGQTLRIHSETARVQRRHRAEERAYLAPLKMIFPTVMFLMPAFFLVAMAPPLLRLIQILKTLGH